MAICWTSFTKGVSYLLQNASLLPLQVLGFLKVSPTTTDRGEGSIQNGLSSPCPLGHLTLRLEAQAQPGSGQWYNITMPQTQVRGEDPVTTAA